MFSTLKISTSLIIILSVLPLNTLTAGRINKEAPSHESTSVCSQSTSHTCHLHPVKLKTQYRQLYIACSDSA